MHHELKGYPMNTKSLKSKERPSVELLKSYDYFAGTRDPRVNPEFSGCYMVNDRLDKEGYAIVGDDLEDLVKEACRHLDLPIDEETF